MVFANPRSCLPTLLDSLFGRRLCRRTRRPGTLDVLAERLESSTQTSFGGSDTHIEM